MQKCKTCPFIKNTQNFGRADWLVDVKRLFENHSLKHSCHVTDPQADGYINGQPRDCVGIKQLYINNCSEIHMFEDVFRNVKEFFKHHLKAYEVKK